MSDYIYNWLNYVVGMYPFITDFKEDFYNGYKFGNLLMKLEIISIDYFIQNYKDSNDKNIIDENYEKLINDLKEGCRIDLTPNMIQPILEKDLTAALNLIYKIKVSNNNQKIGFDQIRTFDIYADQEEIQKRFNDMASFGLDTISDNEDDKLKNNLINKDEDDNQKREILPYNNIKIKVSKKDKKKKLIHRGSMEELSIEYLDDRKKSDFDDINIPKEKGSINLNKSQRLKPIVALKNISKYKNHKNDINYLLNTNIDEENKKELENRFDVNAFSGNLHKMGFNINMPQLKYLNGTSNLDMSQDTVMLKVKEQLKERLKRKMGQDIEKQEMMKNELQKSLFLPIANQKEINFFDPKKNPFNQNKTTEHKDNLRYTNFDRRLNYEKTLIENKKNKIIEKRMKFFRSLIIKNKEQSELEKEQNKPSIAVLRDTHQSFRKTFFFTELDQQPLEKSLEIASIKKNNIINDNPLIRKITHQIIDYAFECYLYQKENNKELIDLSEFKEWNRRFVIGKPLIDPIFDAEADEIKNKLVSKKKIKWTINNEREILDYINYTGEWDDRFIIPKEIRGKSIEFIDIYHHLNDDFEPTKEEIEDVIIPSYPVQNYRFCELVSNVLEYKFPINNKGNGEQIGKWDYIPIKISMLGYPLSGKKTQAELINIKFPKIKIISVFDIIKEKVKEWNEINEPIENHPKFKTLKPNQIEQMKEEQEKKIEEFKSNNTLINPYIEDTDENKKPSDEILLKLLINAVENEFPIKTKEECLNEIIERQKKLKELNDKLKELKEENVESKKPNLKGEQDLEKEIENIKNETFIGFIITDYPKTFSQCVSLENYLTGYIDPTSKPKPLKEVELDNLSYLLDLYYKPKEDNTIIKGGLDYIVNLNVNEDIINDRFNNARYDPLTGKIYNESEINKDGKINIDKKIYERLTNEVPDFANNNFENMKNEYIDNWSKIERFYSKFGINNTTDENNLQKKNVIHLFQQIDNLENKDDITNYIIDNLIKVIHEENEKKEEKIYSEHEKEKDEDEMEKIKVERIKSQLTMMKKEKEKEKEISLIAESSNTVFREMTLLSDKYNRILKNFIQLIDNQYDDLCKRYNLIQRKFEKFLSLQTDKKKLIRVYIKKFNNFLKRFPSIANHEIVAREFKNDIEDLISKLWLYVKEKQIGCINELNEIFNSCFFENEMNKFYSVVLDVFKIETEKYLIAFELILKIYGKKNEEEKEEKSLNVDSEIIFKDIVEFDNKKIYPLQFFINNINIIFLNSIKLIISQQERIKEFETQIKSQQSNLNESTYSKVKRKTEGSSLATTHTKFVNENTLEDKIKKILTKEKLKFKFRMQVLKYYSIDYLTRISYTTDRVHSNMDAWIIVSVKLQNKALNNVREILNKFIEKVQIIPEDYFNKYHLDTFDADIEVYDQINYEHILGSNKRERHFHIEFNYDVDSLRLSYEYLKQYNFEYNVIPKNVFMEMFLKNIFFNRNDNNKRININCISPPLKYLSYKNVMKLVDKLKVSYVDDKNEIIDENEDIENRIIDKENVYEEYINYGQFFTVISLIGSEVIHNDEVEKIENEFKDKFIKGNYITKEDFLNYKFWFENDEYLEGKIESLKEFLFEIWKDEKGELFNLKEFINCLDPEKHGGKKKDKILLIDYYNFAFN